MRLVGQGWRAPAHKKRKTQMQYKCVQSDSLRVHMQTVCALVAAVAMIPLSTMAQTDPGPRSGPAAAGSAYRNLTGGELAAFTFGSGVFQEVDSVSGALSAGSGLGPRFNMDSCSGCHAYPAVGGSAPAGQSAEIAVATKAGATKYHFRRSSVSPARFAKLALSSIRRGNPMAVSTTCLLSPVVAMHEGATSPSPTSRRRQPQTTSCSGFRRRCLEQG